MFESIRLALSGFLLMPLLVLGHELGHALPALCLRTGPVAIVVGRSSPAVTFRTGRLSLSLSPFGAYGVCLAQDRSDTRARSLVWMLGGPVASIATALAAALAAESSEGPARAVLGAAALIAAVQAVTSLTPRWAFTQAGVALPTDGLRASCALRRVALPPRPAKRTGLNDPVDAMHVVDVLAGMALLVLLLSRALPPASLWVFLGMAAQVVAGRRRPARRRPSRRGTERSRCA
jgi:hypothetical protein